MMVMKNGIDEYLALRRSLGFRLERDERLLRDFVVFLNKHGGDRITTTRAVEFAKLSDKASTEQRAKRLTAIRNFARHWKGIDSTTEVPAQGVFKHRIQRAKPHIYTDEEVANIVAAASIIQSGAGISEFSHATIFGLLAVTGMRIGELMGLNLDDVDLTKKQLTIHSSKFNKSRIVPVHDSTIEKLQVYLKRRSQFFPVSQERAFFLANHGGRLTNPVIRIVFMKASIRIGLRQTMQGNGPRMHDFRHTFAVKTLLGWYRSGANIEQQLPVLSTYLGHTCPSHTYSYLSMIPELMELVADRLDRHMGVGI